MGFVGHVVTCCVSSLAVSPSCPSFQVLPDQSLQVVHMIVLIKMAGNADLLELHCGIVTSYLIRFVACNLRFLAGNKSSNTQREWHSQGVCSNGVGRGVECAGQN